MNKSELVDFIAEDAEVTKVVAARMVNSFVAAVTKVLSDGNQVVIPGFGTFLTGHRAARTGRNPQTGKQIEIKASRVAKFKAGKSLKEAVQ